MDEDDIKLAIKGMGLKLDQGCLIDGPFIPDGTIRVYDPETSAILGSGDSLTEAYNNAKSAYDFANE
jgi:hypothetical protein